MVTIQLEITPQILLPLTFVHHTELILAHSMRKDLIHSLIYEINFILICNVFASGPVKIIEIVLFAVHIFVIPTKPAIPNSAPFRTNVTR